MPTIRAVPIGVGHFLPERIVTNNELAKTVDTSDEWIKTRTCDLHTGSNISFYCYESTSWLGNDIRLCF